MQKKFIFVYIYGMKIKAHYLRQMIARFQTEYFRFGAKTIQSGTRMVVDDVMLTYEKDKWTFTIQPTQKQREALASGEPITIVF